MSVEDPIDLYLRGQISAPVAVTRLLLHGTPPEAIRHRLASLTQTHDLRAIAAGAALERMQTLIEAAGVDHADTTSTHAIAAMFDRAVSRSPEASVALYTLGDPAILQASTAEIIAWLRRQGLLRPAMDMLDLGCGIGRIAHALSGDARRVLGLDISPAMINEAERRAAGLPNLRFALTDGRDLSSCPDACFDLVLAVDSFPYLVQAGLAETHMHEIARVLRPAGTLVIFNLSYRGDFDLDRQDARRWAEAAGMTLRDADPQPLRLWDAATFIVSFRTQQGFVGSTTSE